MSILPGPVRGADPQQWAQATLTRFAGLGVRTVFSHGAELGLLSGADGPLTVLDLTTVAHEPSTGFKPVGAAAETPAVLQGTAGSTGNPRTAQLSAEAVLNNVNGLLSRFGVDPAVDVGCTWLPLYHDMGLTFLLSGTLTGAPMWLAPTSAFTASPFRWLRWLSESGASLTAAPNMAYSMIGKYARLVSDVDLGRVRVTINGGEPVDCAGMERFANALSGFGFRCRRAGAVLRAGRIHLRGHDPRRRQRPAVRRSPFRRRRFRAASARDSGRADPRDGNPDQPDAGAFRRAAGPRRRRDRDPRNFDDVRIFRRTPLEPGAWFPTGDLGYLTDDGLVVCGRAKEIITIAGRNVFPAEIERVAAEIRGVREGAVVAVGTDDDTTRPGLVITAEFRGPDEAGARSELVAKVASECGIVPANVVFVRPGSLPRTSSGKLRRLEVKRNLTAVTT